MTARHKDPRESGDFCYDLNMPARFNKLHLPKYEKRVYKVLREQNFILGKKEHALIRQRLSKGRRYFFMVGKRHEGRKVVERFLKIPENNARKLLLPFRRSIEIALYLKAKNVIATRGVIAANYDPQKGIPFAIYETFPAGRAKIGFIEKNKGVELLGSREAKKIIDQLVKFHGISVSTLPPQLKKILVPHPGSYIKFRKEVLRYVNGRVKPLDHKGKTEPLSQILERRTGIVGIKEKAQTLLDRSRSIIDTKGNQKITMVHGDLAPNNFYVFDSGDVEFLDLEWAGTFTNSALAMILDFGNLRARSWNNAKLRKLLDYYLLEAYRGEGKELLGKAIIQLSILRSHIMLSGFFENYTQPRQRSAIEARRRKETERDIAQAFESP